MRSKYATIAVTLVLAVSGCSRMFWRDQADRDSYSALAEKQTDERWHVPRIDVSPDPRSRFYDGSDPDRPPLPPDDPAAHRYMHLVNGIRGYKSWHKYGYELGLENPQWYHSLRLSPEVVARSDDDSENGRPPYRFEPDAETMTDSRLTPVGYQTEAEGDVPPLLLPTPPVVDAEPSPEPMPLRGPELPAPEPAFPDPSETVDPLLSDDDLDENTFTEPNPLPGNAETQWVLKDLTLPESLELATIHSRDYQTQIENQYLAALALTFERFQFDVRYLGTSGREPGGDFQARFTGEDVPVQNQGRLNSRIGISRFLPSGGQIAVELANNTLWLFSNPGRTTTASTLSYSLTQPLLFAAGRKIALEPLVQAERDVLYATRSLARFRRTFFTGVITGGNGYLSLLQQRQFIQNQIGNVARLEEQLERLRVLNSRGGRVSERIYGLPDDLEANGFPDALTADPTGSTGTLFYNRTTNELVWYGPLSEEQEELLINLVPEREQSVEETIRERLLTEFVPSSIGEFSARMGAYNQAVRDARADYFRRAVRSIIQSLNTPAETLAITQLKNQLANQRNSLRQSERGFQDSLDQFKILIGLPTDLPVTIDTSLLKPFELIAPELLTLENDLDDFVETIYTIDDDEPTIEQVREVLARLLELQEQLEAKGLSVVEQDLDRVRGLIDVPEGEEPETDPETETITPDNPIDDDPGTDNNDLLGVDRTFDSETERQRVTLDVANDGRLLQSLRSEYRSEFFFDLNSIEQRIQRLRELAAETEFTTDRLLNLRLEIIELRDDMLRLSRNLQVVQTDLRVELLPLQPFDIGEEEALSLALANRLDLMNVRGFVMDARRNLEVQANRLEAVLNVRAEGDLNTGNTNNPLDLRGSTTDFRLGLEFAAPVDRVGQRNAYRAALIAYQRARRDYIAFEDQVKFDVRTALRQLAVLKENFETARQAVRTAARQYDNAVEQAAKGEGNSGLNLLNALGSLLSSQNNLISIYVNYERNRLAIYRDMGIMRIDPRGIWVDDFYQRLAEKQLRTGSAPTFDPDWTPPPIFPPSPLAIPIGSAHNHIGNDLSGISALLDVMSTGSASSLTALPLPTVLSMSQVAVTADALAGRDHRPNHWASEQSSPPSRLPVRTATPLRNGTVCTSPPSRSVNRSGPRTVSPPTASAAHGQGSTLSPALILPDIETASEPKLFSSSETSPPSTGFSSGERHGSPSGGPQLLAPGVTPPRSRSEHRLPTDPRPDRDSGSSWTASRSRQEAIRRTGAEVLTVPPSPTIPDERSIIPPEDRPFVPPRVVSPHRTAVHHEPSHQQTHPFRQQRHLGGDSPVGRSGNRSAGAWRRRTVGE